MKPHNHKIGKIAFETMTYLFFSHLYYLVTILIIHLAVTFLNVRFGEGERMTDFLTFSFTSAKIYLVIMGIIGGYHYFPAFVQVGVSCKQTFKGKALGMFGGAAALVLMAILVSTVQRLLLASDILKTESLVDTLLSANQQGGSAVRWVLTAVIFWLTAVLDLVVGWLVGAGFYGGRRLVMLGVLLAGFGLLAFSMLWEIEAWTFLSSLAIFNNSASRILLTPLAIGIGLLLVRQLTKKVTIKL